MVLNRQRRQLSRFNRFMLWIHYALILSLLIAVAAKYISPALFWIPAFFGLAFPFLFLINLAFLFYWLIQLKPVLIFGLVALLMSLPTASRYVQWSFPKKKISNHTFKVTSYNSMLFDLYNWKKNRENRLKILTELSEINPDILCVQEFYTSEEKNDYNNLDTIKQILNTSFVHNEYTTTLRGNDHWGIATFCKFPIVNQGKIEFKTRSNNLCIFTDVLIGKDTVRIYNVHLQSISFSKDDNKFLDEVITDKEATDEMVRSKNILRRLKRAFLKRSIQVDMIALHMSACKYKIILCGDFNDTAASYVYERLSKNLKDAFVERGNGFGRTYAGDWPQFRIDYIFYDKSITCFDFKRNEVTFTDHHPITAVFKKMR
jgi:endonuclease/exonuclease/phosphatase family metal-dependent hydrolase